LTGGGKRPTGTRTYADEGLGVPFRIDARFRPGAPVAPSAAAALEGVRSACFVAGEEDGGRAVFSISAVDLEYATSSEWLDEQLPLHNAHLCRTAAERGWTIHRPWEPGTLTGAPAMRNDYETPERGEDEPAGHIQGLVAYRPGVTLQLLLGVHPPSDLGRKRAVMDVVAASLEFLAAGR
jgi:hypothetical protein